MCFFSFLRSGEVTVPSKKEYDPGGQLSEGDVTLDNVSVPTLVQVRIKASKTDPFRKGVVVYLGRTDNDLCPVGAVAAYLAVRGREPVCKGGTTVKDSVGQQDEDSAGIDRQEWRHTSIWAIVSG